MKHQDFLFELGCEELPAAELAPMAQHLEDSLKKALQALKLQCGETKTYYTPRRLALLIRDLQVETEASTIERRGPAKTLAFDANATPTKALEGFLKSSQACLQDVFEVLTDKGPWLAIRISQPAVAVKDILPKILEEAIKTMPLKKTMRWGNRDIRFLRPVHWVVALLGNEVVPMELFGLQADQITYGHRFHHPGVVSLKHPLAYLDALRAARVMADPDERRATIVSKTKALLSTGIEAKFGTLEEVINLVEWPVPLLCHFEKEFLLVPQAALISTMEANQRVFPIVNKAGALQNYFVTVANIESKNPASVVQGNEKVVRARLSDAQFFYDEDLKVPLEHQLEALKKITFQHGLGSLFDKTERLKKEVQYLCETVPDLLRHSREGGNPALAEQAAALCKTDLVTQMVQEFPELQGYMGHQYAVAQGKSKMVGIAIEDHYKPKGRGGDLPRNEIGAILALADKIDTLLGLFAIGKEPTSSGDPFALRRQALGVIAIEIDRKMNLDLSAWLKHTYTVYREQGHTLRDEAETLQKLQCFLEERFVVWCRDEKSMNPSVLNAITKRIAGQSFSFTDAFEKAEAFTALIKTEEGKVLVELMKRVSHVLDPKQTLSPVNSNLFGSAEHALWSCYQNAVDQHWSRILPLPGSSIQEGYLRFLAFKEPIADFFENVMVNDPDPQLKANRQNLLQHIHALFQQLADFNRLIPIQPEGARPRDSMV